MYITLPLTGSVEAEIVSRRTCAINATILSGRENDSGPKHDEWWSSGFSKYPGLL